jgi:hypothetical protein
MSSYMLEIRGHLIFIIYERKNTNKTKNSLFNDVNKTYLIKLVSTKINNYGKTNKTNKVISIIC